MSVKTVRILILPSVQTKLYNFFFFFFRIDDIMTLAIPYKLCDGTSADATSGGRGAVLPLTTTCAHPFWLTPTVVFGTTRNDKTTDNDGTRNNNV